MDANVVLREELRQRDVARVNDLAVGDIVDLVLRYAVWIPVDTYVRAPWLAPYAIRKARHRIEPHAPGPRRDLWGLPDSDGYFSDDNSLLKAVVLRSEVSPSTSPYGDGRITRGMVCCHVWAGTTGNSLLFSFIPNLVWLPSDLAGYSDAHLASLPHKVHTVLKIISTRRYRSVNPAVAPHRVAAAWQLLPPETSSGQLTAESNEFLVGDRLVNLVAGRLFRLTKFLAATLDSTSEPPRRFSKRYHAGSGAHIDMSVWPIQTAVTEKKRRRLLEEMLSCRHPDTPDQFPIDQMRDGAHPQN